MLAQYGTIGRGFSKSHPIDQRKHIFQLVHYLTGAVPLHAFLGFGIYFIGVAQGMYIGVVVGVKFVFAGTLFSLIDS